jgi:hypothetical protein
MILCPGSVLLCDGRNQMYPFPRRLLASTSIQEESAESVLLHWREKLAEWNGIVLLNDCVGRDDLLAHRGGEAWQSREETKGRG